MITGQTPFQSTSQTEIYRRARSVEYSWPEDGTHVNHIPSEAKDLVCRLLRIDAEERPDPDQIVAHPFFSMGGGNMIPEIMEEHFKRQIPAFLDVQAQPRGDTILPGFQRLSLHNLAKACGVGGEDQMVVGADVDVSLYKVCAIEEAAGRSPVIPLPENKVYVSPYSSIKDDPVEHVPEAKLGKPRKNLTQSHAASLRAAHVPNTSSRRPLTTMPVRPARTQARITRSQTELSTPGKLMTKDQMIDRLSPNPDEERKKLAAKHRTRIASNIQNEIHTQEGKEDAKISSSLKHLDLGEKTNNIDHVESQSNSEGACQIFGHDDNTKVISSTHPDHILMKLQTLESKLRESLQNAKTASRAYSAREIESKSLAFTHRPLVKVWVDYTNRFGIGYILGDGTVGCLFNKKDNNPPVGLVVPNAEVHVKSRKQADYANKDQLVPANGLVQFVNCDPSSDFRTAVWDSQDFRVKVAQTGKTEFERNERSVADHHRRRGFILWNNFAQYMVRSLVSDHQPTQTMKEASLCVTFYQSLGNVGIYGFTPLSFVSKKRIIPLFQFNFPDHSKVVLLECEKASGTYLWVDFYYLSQSRQTVLERTMLSYPLSVLLKGHYEEHQFDLDLEHFQFRNKICYIKDVIEVWTHNRGLGRIPEDISVRDKMRWRGTDDSKRNVWTKVGGQ